MQKNTISKTLMILQNLIILGVFGWGNTNAIASIDSEIRQAQLQVLKERQEEYNRFLEENPCFKSRDDYYQDLSKRELNSLYSKAANESEQYLYDRRNTYDFSIDHQLELRVQTKIIQFLATKDYFDECDLLSYILNDAEMSIRYPTNIDRWKAISNFQTIHSQQKFQKEEVEGGFFNGLKCYVSRKWNGAADLPLSQLNAIKFKLDLRNQVLEEIDKAKEDLYSYSEQKRVNALRNLEYYNGTIKGLELNADEYKLWSKYSDKYYKIQSNSCIEK
jgi:hypothetical protein